MLRAARTTTRYYSVNALRPALGRHLAERIRQTISHVPVEVHPGLSIEFTLCIGMADLIPDRGTADFELLRERLLERADAALYQVKEGGRNRVELYRGE